MNEQYGGKTQVVSITAGLTMAVVLIGATGFIEYLPVPVLTAIVISALMNVVETHLAVRLFKVSRNEFYIFIAAGIGVLFLCCSDFNGYKPSEIFPWNDSGKRSLL